MHEKEFLNETQIYRTLKCSRIRHDVIPVHLLYRKRGEGGIFFKRNIKNKGMERNMKVA
jgi:hypothetical protein